MSIDLDALTEGAMECELIQSRMPMDATDVLALVTIARDFAIYGDHLPHCAHPDRLHAAGCVCGFDDALALLAAPANEETR